MADKFSYESLYKFIVSIGIFLALFPFLTLYTISKLANDMIVSNKTIKNATKISREIIEKKQNIYLYIIDNPFFYIFLLIVFLFGIFCIVNGINKWSTVQKNDDYKKELEAESLEIENQRLKNEYGITEKDKIKKVKQEVLYEQKYYGYQNSVKSIMEYYIIEQKVAKKIIKDFSKTHNVVYGFRLGAYEYDIVAKGKGFLNKDYFFEIKYLKKNIQKDWFKKLMDKISKQKENYINQTNRLPYVKIVIVTEEIVFEKVKFFISKQDEINNLSIDVLKKSDINDFDYRL